MKTPKSSFTEGALLKEVELVAGDVKAQKSTLPSPLKEKDEVSSSACVGNRKTREHVLPESEGGISKLNREETVEEIVPLKEVPGAVLGEEESIGIIK